MGVLVVNGISYSGGGGTDYFETTLWSGSVEASTSGDLITLSASITNFDAIYFIVGSGTSWYIPAWYITSQLTVGEHYVGSVNADIAANWYLTSASSITVTSMSGSNKTTYSKVVGVKFGGGSGGSSSVNYSTTEHIVGTWIDGSDVYEQTIEITSYDGATTSISIPGLSKLVSITGFGIYNNSQCMS